MCVEEVTRWFHINGLLLNASKTEAIAFGTRQQLVKRSTETSLKIGDASLAIVDNVKLLGVIFDSTLRWTNRSTLSSKHAIFTSVPCDTCAPV